MSETEFFKDVGAHMMAFYMEDENFAEYKKWTELGKDKLAHDIFEKCARSVI